MDVATTVIDKEEAAEQLAAYRTIKTPDEEERAIIAALVAAAAGKALVNLNDAILGGGTFDDGCPRLAVMAVDRSWCWVARSQDGTVTFQGAPNSHAQAHTFTVKGFQTMTWEELRAASLINTTWGQRRRTQVPIVPPQHRVRGWRTKCVILWEVEEWARHTPPRPPGDPMLLRHVIDDLYSVEAVWYLTPLEQMVLGARR
jgi:hypothetical protein